MPSDSRIAEGMAGRQADRGPEVDRLRDVSPQQWRDGHCRLAGLDV